MKTTAVLATAAAALAALSSPVSAGDCEGKPSPTVHGTGRYLLIS